MGFADDSNTGDDTTQHKAYELLSENFGQGFNGPLMIVVDLAGSTDPAALAEIGDGCRRPIPASRPCSRR